MQVAYWQLTIVATITLAFWLSRRPNLRARTRIWILPWAMGVFWVVWTLGAVFASSLLNLQLLVVSGAMVGNMYFGFTLRQARKADERAQLAREENRALRARIEELTADLHLSERDRKELLEAAARPGSRPTLLETKQEHQDALFEQIRSARNTLCITSGWINDRVVNRDFLAALRAALKRGVLVAIAFGYASKHDPQPLASDAERAFKELSRIVRSTAVNGKPRLFIAIVPIHAKVVVRDAEVAIVSSSNWLSNAAFYNAERGVLLQDAAFALQMQRSVMLLVEDATMDSMHALLRSG